MKPPVNFVLELEFKEKEQTEGVLKYLHTFGLFEYSWKCVIGNNWPKEAKYLLTISGSWGHNLVSIAKLINKADREKWELDEERQEKLKKWAKRLKKHGSKKRVSD